MSLTAVVWPLLHSLSHLAEGANCVRAHKAPHGVLRVAMALPLPTVAIVKPLWIGQRCIFYCILIRFSLFSEGGWQLNQDLQFFCTFWKCISLASRALREKKKTWRETRTKVDISSGCERRAAIRGKSPRSWHQRGTRSKNTKILKI